MYTYKHTEACTHRASNKTVSALTLPACAAACSAVLPISSVSITPPGTHTTAHLSRHSRRTDRLSPSPPRAPSHASLTSHINARSRSKTYICIHVRTCVFTPHTCTHVRTC